jgi:hypothetical protein
MSAICRRAEPSADLPSASSTIDEEIAIEHAVFKELADGPVYKLSWRS